MTTATHSPELVVTGGKSFWEGFKESPIYETLALADFRWVWLGSLASFMAMNMDMLDRGWLVLRLSNDSPSALTWVMVSMALPMTVMSLVGGALADRFTKKYLIMISQLGTAGSCLVVAILDATGAVWLGALMVTGFLNGCMMAINMPARQSIVSEIVPPGRIMNAIALNNTTMNMTRGLGPAVGGIMIAFLDTSGVFYVIALLYVFSALSMIPIKTATADNNRPRKSVTGDIREGLSYVIGDPVLRGMAIMALMPALFGYTIMVLMPAWGREVLNVSSYDLGYLMSFTGLGAVLGTLALASLRSMSRKGWALLTLSSLWGISVVGLATSIGFIMAIFFLFAFGLLSAIYMSLNMSISQMYAEPEKRGRVMSIFMMSFGLMPLSALPFGEMAEFIGTPQTLVIAGLMLTILTIVFGIVYPRFRQMD